MTPRPYLLLTGPNGLRQSARSLSYAKALAPQLLLRMGTQCSMQGGGITIYERPDQQLPGWQPIAQYTTKEGWQDVRHTEPIAA